MLKQLLSKFNWKDIGERSVKTFVEIFVAIAGVDTLSGGFIDDDLSVVTKYIFILITSVVGTILCTVINVIKHILEERLSEKYDIDIDLDTDDIEYEENSENDIISEDDPSEIGEI